MKKIIGSLIKLLLVIIILIFVYFIVSGYILYRVSIKSKSLEEKIKDIREADNYVKLEDMPEYYWKAVVAVEDKRFFEHGPIDVKSILRAVIINIKDMNFTEGGSSITQQLSKNLCFSQEKKLERKVAEIFASYDLEKILSKEEILELYINVIYYGDGYIGIYDASHGYFDKDPADLTFYEATLLSGIPNAPSVYALSNGNTYVYERQKEVINAMVKQGYITQNEALDRLNEEGS